MRTKARGSVVIPTTGCLRCYHRVGFDVPEDGAAVLAVGIAAGGVSAKDRWKLSTS